MVCKDRIPFEISMIGIPAPRDVKFEYCAHCLYIFATKKLLAYREGHKHCRKHFIG